jgi:predicted small lipoprotein YifL
MLRIYQILASTIVLVGSAVNLSACGQQGPLYLPTPAQTQVAAPVPKLPASAASKTPQ